VRPQADRGEPPANTEACSDITHKLGARIQQTLRLFQSNCTPKQR
jgi:hypothetical protein